MTTAPPEVFHSLEEQLENLSEITPKVTHVTPQYIDSKVSSFNIADIQEAIAGRMQLRNKNKLTQSSARIIVPTIYPINIIFIGDVHYGSGDTDHELFYKHHKLIMDTPNTYVILMSNLIDNAIPGKFPDGMLQNVVPPEEQVIAMRKYVQEWDEKGKVLGAITSPCHEGWTWQKAGQDINRLLFGYDGRKFPVLENGSKMLVLVNEAEYYIAPYHQLGPFNSNLNKNNGPQRMRQLNHSKADIVAGAHHHVSEALQTYVDRNSDIREVCYLRTGCYKLDDQWARGRGYNGGEPGGQTVLVYPGPKKMQPFLNLETAIEVQQALYLKGILEHHGLYEKVCELNGQSKNA